MTNEQRVVAILHLAPCKLSGHNTCPYANKCKDICLNTSGFGRYQKVQQARIFKTRLFFESRKLFLDTLIDDIKQLQHKFPNKKIYIRLNGSSDIAWERYKIDGKTLMNLFPSVTFYDYTKNYNRLGKTPKNYTLIMSRDNNKQEKQVIKALNRGFNAGIVFRKIPTQWNGFNVVNADNDDIVENSKSLVLGLSPKGKAKTYQGEFVL